MATTTVYVYASHDATIYAPFTYSSTYKSEYCNGTGNALYAGASFNNPLFSKRTLLYFNVAGSIPSGSSISDAQVNLYMSRYGTTPANETFYIHRLLNSWGEYGFAPLASGPLSGGQGVAPVGSAATWSYRYYAYAGWSSAGGDYYGFASSGLGMDQTVGWHTWANGNCLYACLRNDVSNWVNSGGNYGWIVLGYPDSTDETARQFTSRESGTAPYLYVAYTKPLGATCSYWWECTSSNCTDGVCCNVGSCQPAGECYSAGNCAAGGGYCTNPAKGYGVGCSTDSSLCTLDICDGSGSCIHPAGNAGTVCRASAGPCDPQETCDGSSTSCPGDSYYSGNVCRSSAGPCDVAETCPGNSPNCPADSVAGSGTVCRAAADVCDVAETCDGVSTTCPGDSVATAGTPCRPSAGPCDVTEACNGSSVSCPADGFQSSSTVCRPAADVCDIAENCTGSSAGCPADGFKSSSTTCRASAGVCDIAENCTGSSAACPADGFKLSSTVCRAAADVCDVAEKCTGSAAICPTDAYAPNGTSCRSASCDAGPPAVATLAASCTGTSTACPAVQTVSCSGTCGGTQCAGCTADNQCLSTQFCLGGACTTKRPVGQPCSADDYCQNGSCVDGYCCGDATGSGSSTCGGGVSTDCQSCNQPGKEGKCTPLPAQTVCRAAAGACDAAETCNGTAVACPADAKQPAGTVCRPSAGACDPAESCDGAANACPADTLSATGTVCRASAGACDVAETCSGTAAACPPDVLATSATVCRPSAGPCDVAENCTGSAPTCPQNTFKPAATLCRTAAGPCDVAEACTGTAAACPTNTLAAAGTVCRPAIDVCDTAESCDGLVATCPADAFLPSSTQCRVASCSANVATPAAKCTGSGPTCPPAQTKDCSPYACSGSGCGTQCGADGDCTFGNYCAGTSCQSKEDNGGACTAPDQCKSGLCVDGFCCDKACTGQCEACDVKGREGTCSAVQGPPHGARAACASDGSACAGSCDGSNPSACAYPGNATQCRAPSCTKGTATLAANCQGNGSCPPVETQDCAPNACGPTQCLGGCATDTQCASGNYCSAGVCKTRSDNGSTCTSDHQCKSQHCVDGVCCNTDCAGQCEACNLVGEEGTCSPVTGSPVGSRPACRGESPCAGACDGTRTDACAYPGAGTVCRAASCSGGHATVQAFCDGAGDCPALEQVDCGANGCAGAVCGNGCTTSCGIGEYCAGGVCLLQKSNGDACASPDECSSSYCVDGVCCDQACMGQCEACNVTGEVGACSPVVGAPVGTRSPCASDGSVCHGACDGSARDRCVYPDGTISCRTGSCQNGLATLPGSCQGDGSCSAIQQESCDPNDCDPNGFVCDKGCAQDTDCGAGQFCAGGVCTGTLPNGTPCNANGQCTSTYCVEGFCCDKPCTGQCESCAAEQPGTCSPIEGAPRAGKPPCAGSGTCGGYCDGTNGAACNMPGSLVKCGTDVCSDGVVLHAPTCNGAGTCQSAVAEDCYPYVCDDSGVACVDGCHSDADCAPGTVCNGTACGPAQQEAGAPADAGAGRDASVDAGASAGGSTSVGGSSGAGGVPGSFGGATARGGASGAAGSSTPVDAGADASSKSRDGGPSGPSGKHDKASHDAGSCGCRMPGRTTANGAEAWLVAAALSVLFARRRRSGTDAAVG